mgnify:CR=1 FL=1
MKFTTNRKSRAIAVLEITPLIDVVFLLLLFFLLTATYVKNPNIDIDLPKASSQEIFPKEKDVVIAIRKDGTIKHDTREVTMAQLESILTERFKKGGAETVVVVKADKGARHGKVVEVMDLAKRLGFGRLAIAVNASASGEK